MHANTPLPDDITPLPTKGPEFLKLARDPDVDWSPIGLDYETTAYPGEKWRHHPYYRAQVSNYGRVWAPFRNYERFSHQHFSLNGHMRLSCHRKDGGSDQVYTAQMVWEAWRGPMLRGVTLQRRTGLNWDNRLESLYVHVDLHDVEALLPTGLYCEHDHLITKDNVDLSQLRYGYIHCVLCSDDSGNNNPPPLHSNGPLPSSVSTPKTIAEWSALALDPDIAFDPIGWDYVTDNYPGETWREHPDYPIEVSDHGRVRDRESADLLQQYFRLDGSLAVHIDDGDRRYHPTVTHLVWRCFAPASQRYNNSVKHVDGLKWDNRITALYSDTNSMFSMRTDDPFAPDMCPYGHDLTTENIVNSRQGLGYIQCRACTNARSTAKTRHLTSKPTLNSEEIIALSHELYTRYTGLPPADVDAPEPTLRPNTSPIHNPATAEEHDDTEHDTAAEKAPLANQSTASDSNDDGGDNDGNKPTTNKATAICYRAHFTPAFPGPEHILVKDSLTELVSTLENFIAFDMSLIQHHYPTLHQITAFPRVEISYRNCEDDPDTWRVLDIGTQHKILQREH